MSEELIVMDKTCRLIEVEYDAPLIFYIGGGSAGTTKQGVTEVVADALRETLQLEFNDPDDANVRKLKIGKRYRVKIMLTEE